MKTQMPNVIKVIGGIDWPMLREQKRALISINEALLTDPENAAIQGILNFIDSLQDAAFSDGLAPEDKIYMQDDETIIERCKEIYKESGMDGVINYGNTQNLPAAYCLPCEANTPVIANQCCVCGSRITPRENIKETPQG